MESVRLLKTFKVNSSDLDAHTEIVADELFKLEEVNENLSDADLSAAIDIREVEISIVAVAETFDEAVAAADSAIRAAIHAAGGSTPDWKLPVFSPTSSSAELIPA